MIWYAPHEVIGRVDLGGGMAVVVTDEPMHHFEHLCSRTAERFVVAQEPLVVAPRLSAHTCTGEISVVTVRASILCPDCGLHGFVTDGAWSPA